MGKPTDPQGTNDRGLSQPGTESRGTANPMAGATRSLGVEGSVLDSGFWDDDGRYWYTDPQSGASWVWEDGGWKLVGRPEDAVVIRAKAPPEEEGVDGPPMDPRESALRENPYYRFNAGIGTRWGATRGVFGLGIANYPVAKHIALPVLRYEAGLAGITNPIPSFFALTGLDKAEEGMDEVMEEWQMQADERELELREIRGDLHRMPILIGTNKAVGRGARPTLANIEGFVEEVTELYRSRTAYHEVTKPSAKPWKIGRLAEADVLKTAESMARAHGLDPGHVWIGDYPVGATGPSGGVITTEIGSIEYAFMVELKKSPAANRPSQTESHRVAVYERVNSDGKVIRYYKIYAEGYKGPGVERMRSPNRRRGRR